MDVIIFLGSVLNLFRKILQTLIVLQS